MMDIWSNPKHLLTYGTPIVYDPQKIYTLHVDNELKLKWYQKLWNTCVGWMKNVRRKIKSWMATIRVLCEFLWLRLLILFRGKDYVANKIQKQLEDEIMKEYMKNVNFDFKLINSRAKKSPEETVTVLSELVKNNVVNLKYASSVFLGEVEQYKQIQQEKKK